MSDIEETKVVAPQEDDLKARVEELKRRLGLATGPAEELTPEAQVAQEEAANSENEISGAEINWEDYELDDKYAHLYPKAKFTETAQGPKWIVQIAEFMTRSKAYSGTGIAKNGEPQGLGDFLTWITNGPEGWKVAMILPNGSGMGAVVAQRMVTVVLPDPKLIETETKVDAPTDEELVVEEKKGLEWANACADEAVAALEGEDFGYVTAKQEGEDGSDGDDDPSSTEVTE